MSAFEEEEETSVSPAHTVDGKSEPTPTSPPAKPQVLGVEFRADAESELKLNAEVARAPGQPVVSQPTAAARRSAEGSFTNRPAPDDRSSDAIDAPPGEAFHTASVGDVVAESDSIGFAPYVKALALFLADERTEPPLTLSIEGEWGSGKSSFMEQLKLALRHPEPSPDTTAIESVSFNAWRHENDEALWAAFALAFTRSAAKKLWLIPRLWSCVRLFWRRVLQLELARAFAPLGRAVIFTLVGILALSYGIAYLWYRGADALGEAWSAAKGTVTSRVDFIDQLINLGGVVGFTFVVVLVLRKLADVLGNPLDIDIRKYSRLPDYESRVAFIDRFHADFADIAWAYTRGRKLCVFVDDIDRCEPTKSADLMQAINMMIPECKNLIFVIGMDRQRIAAAVAVKQEKLLPFLARGTVQAHGAKEQSDGSKGLIYGYEFLEKFIQIPFRVPQTDTQGVDTLLDDLHKKKVQPEQSLWIESKRRFQELFNRGQAPAQNEASDSRVREVRQTEETITRLRVEIQNQEKQISHMVAPSLDFNPRRLKQFLNSFRLKSYIAAVTGILDPTMQAPASNKLILKQVGTFVAISLRWPLLLSDLDEERGLLADIHEYALVKAKILTVVPPALREKIAGWDTELFPVDPKKEPTELETLRGRTPLGRWCGIRALLDLLSLNRYPYLGEQSRFGFGPATVEMLLRVSTNRRR